MAEKQRQKRTGIHWIAPATIALSLLLGILFAIGHHLFYKSLDRTTAPNVEYDILGSRVSRQQINIAAGTAFAFLVQSMLVTALSVAYVQLLWRALLHSSKHMTLRRLDVLFAGLSNLFSLAKATTWWRHPRLLMLATLSWLIPIASIVTPATLSIENTISTHSSVRHVPNVQWVSLNYVKDMILGNREAFVSQAPNFYTYNGPSDTVQDIVNEVTATGSILPISYQIPNASWSLRFAGPALRCEHLYGSSRTEIESNILTAMKPGRECKAYGFLAWESGLPFGKNEHTPSFNSSPITSGLKPVPMRIHIAAIRESMDLTSDGYTGYPKGCALPHQQRTALLKKATVVQCNLLNSTYDVRFNYTDGEQEITVDVLPLDHNVLHTLSPIWAEPNFKITGLSTLSYQGIMDAFIQRLIGSIWLSGKLKEPAFDSGVVNTVLTNTPELQFLTQWNSSSSLTLKEAAETWNGLPGLVNTIQSDKAGPLAQSMEKLFNNITIGMMSSQQLRPNVSSQYAPPPVNVTESAFHSLYAYSAIKLWIAYGLAILASSFAAVMGLIALLANDSSHSHNFSSIFRVARRAIMVEEVREEDFDGRDPLPQYLAEAEVSFGGPRTDQYDSIRGQGAKDSDELAKTSGTKRRVTK